MPISVDWGNKIINIPQDYLTQVGVGVYELDLDELRLDLKALEDDEEGMPFPDTHKHNAAVTMAGITLSRVIEFINEYTVTFQDGQYAVNAVGANSNIADVMNINQVSLRTFNSAGLITVVSGSGLSEVQDEKLGDLHKVHGLDVLSPVTVTKTARIVGDIEQRISGDGESRAEVRRLP
jgi:hypothetical protein